MLTTTVRTMIVQAARQAGLAALTCLVLAVLMVMVGKGPFTRWIQPGVLATVAVFVVTAWRARRSGGPSDTE